MKTIIAAGMAACPAALADAQRAMIAALLPVRARSVALGFALATAVFVLGASDAAAQTWTAPGDRFQLTVPAGWIETPALTEDRVAGEWRNTGLHPTILTIRPANRRDGPGAPVCMVQMETYSRSISQQTINDAGTSQTQGDLARRQNLVQAHVFNNAIVDGVRIVEIAGETEPSPGVRAYVRHRFFLMSAGEEAVLYVIVCGGFTPLPDEDQHAIASVFASFRLRDHAR